MTIPSYVVGWAIAVAALPVLVVVAGAADVARAFGGERRVPTLRALCFFVALLTCEVLGILAATFVWLRGRVQRVDEARYLRWNFAFQCWWTATLLGAAIRVFRLRIVVECEELIARGPMIVLMRHSSVADTVLPGVIVSGRHGIRLRYVLKRELLANPCLDLVGLRLRNHFVRRESRDARSQAREIEAVAALADGLASDEGVLIYPEGTRFSTQRRAQILDKLRTTGDPHLAAAEALQRVLPPRLGGPLALLARAVRSDIDVVLCAHVGFEGAATIPRFLGGGLIDKEIRVCFWRVPARELPSDHAAWLFGAWSQIDAWVQAQEREAA